MRENRAIHGMGRAMAVRAGAFGDEVTSGYTALEMPGAIGEEGELATNHFHAGGQRDVRGAGFWNFTNQEIGVPGRGEAKSQSCGAKKNRRRFLPPPIFVLRGSLA